MSYCRSLAIVCRPFRIAVRYLFRPDASLLPLPFAIPAASRVSTSFVQQKSQSIHNAIFFSSSASSFHSSKDLSARSESPQQDAEPQSSSSEPTPHLEPATDDAFASMTLAERSIADLLTAELQPSQLLVQDVSGGCGSMYAIEITSPLFRGRSLLEQQHMVNAALGDLVRAWHGVQIRTSVPDNF